MGAAVRVAGRLPAPGSLKSREPNAGNPPAGAGRPPCLSRGLRPARRRADAGVPGPKGPAGNLESKRHFYFSDQGLRTWGRLKGR